MRLAAGWSLAGPGRACSASAARETLPGTAGCGYPPTSRRRRKRPYGGWFDEVTNELLAALDERGVPAEAIQQVTVDRGEITYYARRDHLVALCRTLRDDPALRFELCSGVSGVDYGPEVPQRLHSVYHL